MKKAESNQKPYPTVKAKRGRKKKIRYQSYLNLKLEIVREEPVTRIQCKNSQDVVNAFFEEASKYTNEVFRCVHMNSQKVVIGVQTISVGSVTCALVNPRDVFKGAIINNAVSVLFFHNHTGGSTKPTQDDLEITKRLKYTGDIVGIDVVDHIIFGSGVKKHFSFVDNKML